ncbi:MAG: hypothetical protein QG656_1243 [Candidatus Hydrogenedentes bacterium]|nr:hypothetical protein [Candidatus Hydrogenedentota bacterium]
MWTIVLVAFGAANLVENGGFESGNTCPAGWEACTTDAVRIDAGAGTNDSRALCIGMEEKTAYGYGQGYFSKPIPVEPGVEYEVSAAVKSEGPNAILFVKGFATIDGVEREVYTKHKEAHFDRYLEMGPYTTLTFRFHPRHPKYRIEHVKVWLYAYLRPGRVWFDDVSVVPAGPATNEPEPSSEPKTKPLVTDDPHPPLYVR